MNKEIDYTKHKNRSATVCNFSCNSIDSCIELLQNIKSTILSRTDNPFNLQVIVGEYSDNEITISFYSDMSENEQLFEKQNQDRHKQYRLENYLRLKSEFGELE